MKESWRLVRWATRPALQQRWAGWGIAAIMAALAVAPLVGRQRAAAHAQARLSKMTPSKLASQRDPVEVALSLRVKRLGGLLSSWETIGGCGAGGSGGAGVGVKWIGRGTTGGLFQLVSQFNYVHYSSGYDFIATTQVARDLTPEWQVGVFVPYLYKYYPDYLELPLDISNSGFGDVSLLVTRRFGPINATSLTANIGLPTGTHDARYKMDLLTQEKQLGFGRLSGSLTLDHTLDQTWGVVVLGGLLAYRGGENDLGSYRSPTGSLYGFAGYFMGPFVPSLGLSFSHFLKADRDRGLDQNVPLTLIAASASLEWSNDFVAVLAGVSVPYSVRGTPPPRDTLEPPKVTGLQPWVAAIGVSVSPF